jgi:5'-3' exonuclease
MKNKIIVIDGNSLLFRAFYATYYGEGSSIMKTKDGTPTNAIFAFANMFVKILQTMSGDESLFVAFDSDSKTFRKEEFDAYKANRKPAPPELIPQFPISRELLDALGVVHYEEHGIEADDICGTVAKMASAKGYAVEIYTSDKDYLQLVDDIQIPIKIQPRLLIMEPAAGVASIEHIQGFRKGNTEKLGHLCDDATDSIVQNDSANLAMIFWGHTGTTIISCLQKIVDFLIKVGNKLSALY